ncbi:MAG TPA: nitronate monooxygenase [Candidatus Marinimicrobia bacterium]|nr:nitronate monooxygenase [Candidatus Neomarinimicrobiota bacterium]
MEKRIRLGIIETAFTETFGIKYPIVLAPMFLVNTEALVIAAAKAGIMGTFPAMNFRPMSRYREAIKKIKEETDAPFGINIIVQSSNKLQQEQLDIALEEGVQFIISSLGSPRNLLQLAHQTNTKVYCDVIGLEMAKKVADLGADGLVAVGAGAGGHAGNISPFALVPILAQKTNLPVLAAGSIVDGRGLAAALSLGASGAYMGTRFIASAEAEVSEEYKSAIINAASEQIVSTHKVDGFPGNFILTPQLKKLGVEAGFWELLVSTYPKFKRLIALSRAAKSLMSKQGPKANYKTHFSAGHGVGLIHSIESVQTIVEAVIAEYQDIKSKLP